MRTGVRVATALLIAAGCGGGPGSGDANGRDTGDRRADASRTGEAVLRVIYVPAEGFAERTADGSVTGVTADLMHAFAQWIDGMYGVRITLDFVEEPDWRTFYNRIRDASGGVFGLGNVTITEARRAELQFSPPYMTNVAVLITHDGVPELESMSDVASVFSTLTPLGFAGTLHETRVRTLRDEYLQQAEVELAQSNTEIIDRVAGGGYFAFIDGYNFWRAEARGAPLRRHRVADDPAETFGIIMPHGNDWAPLLETFLGEDYGFRNSPAYEAILVRHLGADVAAELQRGQ